MHESKNALEIDSYWEYSDPAASEIRFRELLHSVEGDEALEVRTQIARTLGLRQRFEEGHETLNEVERELQGSHLSRARIRCVLERGRLFNSAGDRERARTLFIEAWEQARAAKQEGLAVDAAHMVAITDAGTEEALEWNRRGLELAGPSRDPKARSLIPAMLNNSAWDLHSMERFAEALSYFEKAEAEWTARGKPVQTRIAKWSVARCLRSLGRHGDALARQRAVEEECAAAGTPDGHVFEEIAENLAALGESEDAKVYFGKAYEELNKDEWLRKNEGARLETLAKRASTG